MNKKLLKIGAENALIFDHPAKAIRVANFLGDILFFTSDGDEIFGGYSTNGKNGEHAWRITYTVMFLTAKCSIIKIEEKNGYFHNVRFFNKKDHDAFFDSMTAGE